MSTLRGSRFFAASQMSICDGAVEGFGSLNTAPSGFRLDSSGRLWSTGTHHDQPSGFRMTEDGEIVEDEVLAESAGLSRHFGMRPDRGRT
jgi:hypothetical protein